MTKLQTSTSPGVGKTIKPDLTITAHKQGTV
jgi:hypothetical protein